VNPAARGLIKVFSSAATAAKKGHIVTYAIGQVRIERVMETHLQVSWSAECFFLVVILGSRGTIQGKCFGTELGGMICIRALQGLDLEF
jgi:hypothetical protein